MSKSVLYTSSPLLASKTPVWRSKFIVAAIALGFVGLAIARYIIEQHQGWIDIESEEENGTTVYMQMIFRIDS